jgi:hypothetical protein
VFPETFELWIYLIVSGVIGFCIGQWIYDRRNKTMAVSETINQIESTPQVKRLSKKEPRKRHRS